MYVFCGDRGVEAWTGTYSWEITLPDGTKRGTNADSSHPLACLDSLPVLPLIPSTVSAIEPYQAQLTFAQQPKSVSITRYPVLSDPTGAIEQSPVPCSNGSFGLAYGRNVYEIVATFDSAEGAGTVHYAFSTTTPAIGYITQDDFGLTMDVTLLDNNRIQVTFTHDASNATETGELLTGDVYTLQIKHNNQWVPLQDYLQNVMHYDYNSEEIVFLTIGRMLKALPLNVTGTRPIEEAIVTRGGVEVKEILPGTMMSRKQEGLYFAGEVLDVDAHTGGFNLQIAFSTGALAGKSAAAYALEME